MSTESEIPTCPNSAFEEQARLGKWDSVKLRDEIRLTKLARELAEKEIIPTLDLSGYKRDFKRDVADIYIANALFGHQGRKTVRCSRNASQIRNYKVRRQVQDELVKGRWLRQHKGWYDPTTGLGRQTRYAPDRLLTVYPDDESLGNHVQYRPGELIVLRNEKKIDIPIPDDLDDETLEYLRKREALIRLFNCVNGQHRLTYRVYDPTDECFHGVSRTFSALQAKFSNSSFRQGGRLYGEYQNLRKIERQKLRIDGVRTVEPDYKCLHPAMLYNGVRLPLPDDAYSLYQDQTEILRKGIKTAFNALLNAPTETAALKARNLAVSPRNKKRRLKNWHDIKKAKELKSELTRWGLSFKDIICELKEKHKPISRHFGTSVGLRLQNQDAELVYQVCFHFCRQGIPILPVHDSFRIQATFEEELREVMTAAYRERYKFTPQIT